jgi:hypothetical protein
LVNAGAGAVRAAPVVLCAAPLLVVLEGVVLAVGAVVLAAVLWVDVAAGVEALDTDTVLVWPDPQPPSAIAPVAPTVSAIASRLARVIVEGIRRRTPSSLHGPKIISRC